MFLEGKGTCCCTSDEELTDLGPGVALYFMTLVSPCASARPACGLAAAVIDATRSSASSARSATKHP